MRRVSPLQKKSINQKSQTEKIIDLTSAYTDENFQKIQQDKPQKSGRISQKYLQETSNDSEYLIKLEEAKLKFIKHMKETGLLDSKNQESQLLETLISNILQKQEISDSHFDYFVNAMNYFYQNLTPDLIGVLCKNYIQNWLDKDQKSLNYQRPVSRILSSKVEMDQHIYNDLNTENKAEKQSISTDKTKDNSDKMAQYKQEREKRKTLKQLQSSNVLNQEQEEPSEKKIVQQDQPYIYQNQNKIKKHASLVELQIKIKNQQALNQSQDEPVPTPQQLPNLQSQPQFQIYKAEKINNSCTQKYLQYRSQSNFKPNYTDSNSKFQSSKSNKIDFSRTAKFPSLQDTDFSVSKYSNKIKDKKDDIFKRQYEEMKEKQIRLSELKQKYDEKDKEKLTFHPSSKGSPKIKQKREILAIKCLSRQTFKPENCYTAVKKINIEFVKSNQINIDPKNESFNRTLSSNNTQRVIFNKVFVDNKNSDKLISNENQNIKISNKRFASRQNSPLLAQNQQRNLMSPQLEEKEQSNNKKQFFKSIFNQHKEVHNIGKNEEKQSPNIDKMQKNKEQEQLVKNTKQISPISKEKLKQEKKQQVENSFIDQSSIIQYQNLFNSTQNYFQRIDKQQNPNSQQKSREKLEIFTPEKMYITKSRSPLKKNY